MTLRKMLRNRRPATVAGVLLVLIPALCLAGCGPKDDEPTPTASGGAAPTPQTMPSLPPEVQVGPPK